jgi:hypothetical protein
MNNSIFFDHTFKNLENSIFANPKKINKKIDKVLDDWQTYAYNRVHDKFAMNPKLLIKRNLQD